MLNSVNICVISLTYSVAAVPTVFRSFATYSNWFVSHTLTTPLVSLTVTYSCHAHHILSQITRSNQFVSRILTTPFMPLLVTSYDARHIFAQTTFAEFGFAIAYSSSAIFTQVTPARIGSITTYLIRSDSGHNFLCVIQFVTTYFTQVTPARIGPITAYLIRSDSDLNFLRVIQFVTTYFNRSKPDLNFSRTLIQFVRARAMPGVVNISWVVSPIEHESHPTVDDAVTYFLFRSFVVIIGDFTRPTDIVAAIEMCASTNCHFLIRFDLWAPYSCVRSFWLCSRCDSCRAGTSGAAHARLPSALGVLQLLQRLDRALLYAQGLGGVVLGERLSCIGCRDRGGLDDFFCRRCGVALLLTHGCNHLPLRRDLDDRCCCTLSVVINRVPI